MAPTELRTHAEAIFRAAVAAVEPARLAEAAVAALPAEVRATLAAAPTVHVVGGGKAGAGMAAGLERALGGRLAGSVNVPAGCRADLRHITLTAARPAGSNHPTPEGVAGTQAMLARLAEAGPDDAAVCLLSGGGSALLPCPAAGVPLAEKQLLTKQLHAAGATIGEMNAVRKHLSAVKGGRLAAAFRGRVLVSLILSDVVGDPLDVIASGPTAADPTTFADAVEVMTRYGLGGDTPAAVAHLAAGVRGEVPETPKRLPASVHSVVIGNNQTAVTAATAEAVRRGFPVVNLGSFIEGDTAAAAGFVAGVVRSVRADGRPARPPVCILMGGETTVTLGPAPGRGGRNTHFALAVATALGPAGMAGVCVLSGGTDGEDGPTDAAGAVATAGTLTGGLDAAEFFRRQDSYTFFCHSGGLVMTGLTGTNVADVRVVLVV